MVTPARRTLPVAEVAARDAERATVYVQGRPYSRCPRSMSPVIAKYLRAWMWVGPLMSGDIDPPVLAGLNRRVVGSLGTARGGPVEFQREWMAYDWYCRLSAAVWLAAAGLPDAAAELKAVGPIGDWHRAMFWACDLLGDVRPREAANVGEAWIADVARAIHEAWPGRLGLSDTYQAVDDGIWAATGNALAVCGMDAAWQAAGDVGPLRLPRIVIDDAAWVAAVSAVVSVAPTDVARTVAGRPPETEGAMWIVEAVVADYARPGLLQPVRKLQRSSLRLVDRMIAAGAG